jgi:nucleoid-associated protein YgaU
MNEEVSSTSNYTQSIKKEVLFRTNEMRVIIVQRGDTLSRIAKKAYGDYDDYPRIFAANPEIIKNPNQIFVGQRLRIPA